MGAKKDSRSSGGSALLPGLLGLTVLGGLASAFDAFGSAAAQSRDRSSPRETASSGEAKDAELARDVKRWLERVRPSRPAASDIVRR